MPAKLALKPIPGAENAQPDETVTDTTAPAAATPAPSGPPTVDAIVGNMIEQGVTVDKLTKTYLKIRDSHASLKKQAAEKMAPLVTAMAKIENHFLAKMNEMGVDSLKNAEGTPYKTTRTSITVEDNPTFVDYVLTRALSSLTQLNQQARDAIKDAIIASGQLWLIEARAAKSAVETFLIENEELPAGLKKTSEIVVNVKAS